MIDLKIQETWVITGVAGFIGKNIAHKLLMAGQHVIGIDNFSTSSREEFSLFLNILNKDQSKNFEFYELDIKNYSKLLEIFRNFKVDYVLNQAAIGSVPRSFQDPISTNDNNVSGFVNVLMMAIETEAKKLVYASSSSVYGNNSDDYKCEIRIGSQLSPYAVSKYVNELYADVLAKSKNISTVGLRYFNVYGPWQSPEGQYAAVIPKWINAMINNEQTHINGDGLVTRDFCYVENVVNANILAALSNIPTGNLIANIALSRSTSLNRLHELISKAITRKTGKKIAEAIYRESRLGDIKDSKADISVARKLFGYNPECEIDEGIDRTVTWYLNKIG